MLWRLCIYLAMAIVNDFPQFQRTLNDARAVRATSMRRPVPGPHTFVQSCTQILQFLSYEAEK